MIDDLIERGELYCKHRNLILQRDEKLGAGVHGSVFACRHQSEIVGRNAVKIHEYRPAYFRERDVYLRLRDFEIRLVCGHAVPQLVDFDDELLVIQMSVVVRPFLLDFGGAYLDRAPEFSAEVIEDWEQAKSEQFGAHWSKAKHILSTLIQEFGIYVVDVNPGNIGFVEPDLEG
jgi:hypothetical protein